MAVLPQASAGDTVKALQKAGFDIDHRKGDLIVLKKTTPDGPIITEVPDEKELPIEQLRAVIRKAGMTPDEFLELLNS